MEKAIACYRRQRILAQANRANAALREDVQAWAGTLADDLDGDGIPPE